MNRSNTSGDQENAPIGPFNTTSKLVITVVYSVSILLGLIGNGLSLFLALKKRAGNRITNMLIANMGFADLLVTMFAMPYSIVFIHVGLKWIGGVIGSVTCKFVHFAYQVSIPASIVTVLLVSLDRFFAILYPMKGRLFRRVKSVTCFIWINSAAYAVPFMIANGILEHEGSHYCLRFFSPFDNVDSLRMYYLITFVLLYCVPLVILVFLYSLIARKLWLRKIPGNVSNARMRAVEKEKRRIVKTLILLVAVFAICWFPAHVMHYLVFYRTAVYQQIPPELEIFFFWLCHANSLINPCLYILISKRFRRRLLKLFRPCCNYCCPRSRSFRRPRVEQFTLNPSPRYSTSTFLRVTYTSDLLFTTRL